MNNAKMDRYDTFYKQLMAEYQQRFPRSRLAQEKAESCLVDGGSHGARQWAPYSFRIRAAHGARVEDIDGHSIVDFWQGHYANILGHNPPLITQALIEKLNHGNGLHTGLLEELEAEYCCTLAKAVGAERIRLTTAGTLATMYAIMLARAFTGRKLVLKISGGWHGANPLALKGTGANRHGLEHVDSAGVPTSAETEVLVTPYNDCDTLRKIFRAVGDQIACFIFEPCLGAGGFVPASIDFMRTARELTAQYGAVLILDEVITGFRFCAAGVQKLYSVIPDLSAYGKIIGGGMPISAVAGRADIMRLASENAGERHVAFNGGTFSSHPLSMVAGLTMINYLIKNEATVYPQLKAAAQQLFDGIEDVFAQNGILAYCMGGRNPSFIQGSLGAIYFPSQEDSIIQNAEDFADDKLAGATLREKAFKLGMLLNDVNVVHGLGAVSLAHTQADFEQVYTACEAFALRLKTAGMV